LRSRGPAADWRLYSNVAHQIAQARPEELREFVESYSLERAMVIAPLMVLAWRIVGNEFRRSMAERASEAISGLCDIDEWEKAVMAFATADAKPAAPPDHDGE
jgi:hypothetical protein